MGAALAEVFPSARETFELADQVMGFSLSKTAWEGPEAYLNDTINTQPALLTHSSAALNVFYNLHPGFAPRFVAGHSMGEISALVAAGTLPLEAGLSLARKRGELMKQAGEDSPGGMAAILALDLETVDGICQAASTEKEIVQVANDNCPGQVVISGHCNALERAMEFARTAGARKVVRLAVSIAAHSSLMRSAQEAFNQIVEASPIAAPQTPVIGNVTARPLNTPEEIRQDLCAQLNSKVRWTETIQYMLANGVDTFVEFGSGDVLSGLVKRINRKTKRLFLGTPEDFHKLAA
jgi:[acyl-carrier-protein] S-malonyltransferase